MKGLRFAVLGLSVALSACVTQGTYDEANERSEILQQKLDNVASQQDRLASENAKLQKKLEAANRTVAELQAAPPPEPKQEAAPAPAPTGDTIDLVPSNAKPGQCFARLYTPAKFETKTEKVLKAAESERVTTTPAEYEWTEEKLLVKPESTQIIPVPATYKMVEEKQLVREAHTVWKRGRGANEKIDAKTGDVMCLVEVPAEYRVVRSKVVDQPATTKTITIPAQYKTVKVQKLVKAAEEHRETIPAVYQEVSRTLQVGDTKMAWGRVVCETNATAELIAKVQTALKKEGFHPGPVDNVLGPLTAAAARSYQKAKGLQQSEGNVITYETLESLGIETP